MAAFCRLPIAINAGVGRECMWLGGRYATRSCGEHRAENGLSQTIRFRPHRVVGISLGLDGTGTGDRK